MACCQLASEYLPNSSCFAELPLLITHNSRLTVHIHHYRQRCFLLSPPFRLQSFLFFEPSSCLSLIVQDEELLVPNNRYFILPPNAHKVYHEIIVLPQQPRLFEIDDLSAYRQSKYAVVELDCAGTPLTTYSQYSSFCNSALSRVQRVLCTCVSLNVRSKSSLYTLMCDHSREPLSRASMSNAGEDSPLRLCDWCYAVREKGR
jgi:hypothetical protein